MDVVDSPGRQTDARAELERRVERAADQAAARFLAGVLTDALAAVEGTVMVAAAVEPFTLGQVMTRWAPASERIAAAVVTAAGSPEVPGQVDRTYLARVEARIRASNLPLDVHRDVRDTLTGPLASRLDGRPDRGQMKAALRKSLRAPRERSVYRAQVNRIARTETTSLFGYATQAKLTAEGVPGKRWVAHHDAKTRPTHAAADGQTVAVVDPFLVGGYALMHPGDPAGPAKETASCRCVMTAVKALPKLGPTTSLRYGENTLGRVTPDEFLGAFSAAFEDSPYKHHVTIYSKAEMSQASFTPLLTPDRKAGLAIHDHGDGRIEGTALFNQTGRPGVGTSLLTQGVADHGVNYVECFGPYLNQLYERVGFEVTDTFDFDPGEAPDGWDYATFDNPKYHLLRWKGKPVTAAGPVEEQPRSAALSPEECGELWREVVEHVGTTASRRERVYLEAQRAAAETQV